jgi:hypothetical protein
MVCRSGCGQGLSDEKTQAGERRHSSGRHRSLCAVLWAEEMIVKPGRYHTELTESFEQPAIYPPELDAPDILDYVKEIHHNMSGEDFAEGNLTDRIYYFDNYELKMLPISKIRLEWATDWSEIERYAQMDTPFPPIVYDPVHRSIIDGTHRVKAALERGDETILAYVGKPKPRSVGWRKRRRERL